MIYTFLHFLTEQLNNYIDQEETGNSRLSSPVALPESIVNMEEHDLKTKNNLFLFMFNVSESLQAKNNPGFVRGPGRIDRQSASVFLNFNVHLLLTARMKDYENELFYLSKALQFFHKYPVLNYENRLSQKAKLPARFTLGVEFFSLSFEQTTQLWNALGKKPHPLLCYKLRIMELEF